MAIAATALSLIFIISSCLQMNEGSIRLNPSLMDRNEVDGNRRKFTINLSSDDQNSGDPVMDEIGRRFRRAVTNDLDKIKSSPVSIFFCFKILTKMFLSRLMNQQNRISFRPTDRPTCKIKGRVTANQHFLKSSLIDR